MDFNIDDFERFVSDNSDPKRKLQELVKEAKNANFFVIMVMTKYNSLLDEILKASDEAGDDWFAQMLLYETTKEGLEPVIKAAKEMGGKIKL